MDLLPLYSDVFNILAVGTPEECEVLSFLEDLAAEFNGNKDGILNLMERLSECGFVNISDKLSHEADKKNGIWELIKGRIRIFYFKGNGKDIVICTSGILKSTQKANKLEVKKAIRLKKAYDAALISKNLIVHVDDDK